MGEMYFSAVMLVYVFGVLHNEPVSLHYSYCVGVSSVVIIVELDYNFMSPLSPNHPLDCCCSSCKKNRRFF